MLLWKVTLDRIDCIKKLSCTINSALEFYAHFLFVCDQSIPSSIYQIITDISRWSGAISIYYLKLCWVRSALSRLPLFRCQSCPACLRLADRR